jgi:PKD repeat protein
MTKRTSSRPAGVVGPLVALLGLALLLAACDRVVGPRAEFTIMDRDHGYPPLEVTLDAGASSSPNGAIVSYDWDLGDGETDSGVTVTHTYAEKGVYAITLVVTDSTGETGARTRSVQALNRVPVAIFTFSPFWVGTNQPLTLNASDSYDPDGEIVQYIWSFGDGSSDEGMVVEHEYGLLNGGSWQPTVTLTVIDEDGGSKSTTRKVNVVGCSSCG